MVSVTIDKEGNVYLIPEDVLAKYCKKIGHISEKSDELVAKLLTADWPGCYGWIDGKRTWLNCPEK